MRASNTVEMLFRDAVVPEENRLGEETKGFRYAMAILDSSRIVIAAQCIGIARAAFEEAVRYSQQRRTFGKAIAEHQAIQFMLADMATDIYASQTMTPPRSYPQGPGPALPSGGFHAQALRLGGLLPCMLQCPPDPRWLRLFQGVKRGALFPRLQSYQHL